MTGTARNTFVVLTAAIMLTAGANAYASKKADKGLQQYRDHQFDEAIETCKGEKDVQARMVLALSHTERYKIYKDKTDKGQAKMYVNLLEVDVGMGSVDTLEKFVAVAGNPNGNKEALDLLKRAFKNAKATKKDVLKMTEFLDSAKGDDVNKAALGAIKKGLDTHRDYVNDGGTMPEKIQGLFQEATLIDPLIAALSNKKLASYAKSCLTYIEEPCLSKLEAQDMTKSISDAIVSVKKAIAKRQKKFPESTWFSASGS